MLTNPPSCYLDHEGSFITGFYKQDTLSGSGRSAHPRPGADFNFIPFPPLTSAGQGSEEVSADLLVMFHDTPAARRLIAYLTTPQAQQAWISRPGSGALSVNRQVPLNAYPDPVARALARILTHAASIHFDASNSMPQTMANAFNNAVLQYLDSPAQLNVILHGLDLVRRTTHQQAAAQPTASQPAAAQPTAGQVTVDQLRAGDCLPDYSYPGQDQALNEDNGPFTVAPCTQLHAAEVFFAGNAWPRSLAYPGDQAVWDDGSARCATAFIAYDGIDSSSSGLVVGRSVPDKNAWLGGDRRLVCFAWPADYSQVNYSIRGRAGR